MVFAQEEGAGAGAGEGLRWGITAEHIAKPISKMLKLFTCKWAKFEVRAAQECLYIECNEILLLLLHSVHAKIECSVHVQQLLWRLLLLLLQSNHTMQPAITHKY